MNKIHWFALRTIIALITKSPSIHALLHLLFMTWKLYIYAFEDHEHVGHFTCDISKREHLILVGPDEENFVTFW